MSYYTDITENVGAQLSRFREELGWRYRSLDDGIIYVEMHPVDVAELLYVNRQLYDYRSQLPQLCGHTWGNRDECVKCGISRRAYVNNTAPVPDYMLWGLPVYASIDTKEGEPLVIRKINNLPTTSQS